MGSYLRVKDLSDFVLLLVDIGGDFFGEKGRREDRAGRRRGKGVGLLLVLLLVLFFEGEVEAGGDGGRRAALELGEAHERRRRKRAMQREEVSRVALLLCHRRHRDADGISSSLPRIRRRCYTKPISPQATNGKKNPTHTAQETPKRRQLSLTSIGEKRGSRVEDTSRSLGEVHLFPFPLASASIKNQNSPKKLIKIRPSRRNQSETNMTKSGT